MNGVPHTRLIILLILAVLLGGTAPAAARDQSPEAWTGDKDMLLFFDAVTKIKKHAVTQHTAAEIVRQALKVYLPTLDPYSQYLTAEEFARFQKLQTPEYSGVGMEIARDQNGRVTCLPYPQGPAARAGVRSGDMLLKVDGQRVSRLTLIAVATLIRGKAGDPVTLTLKAEGGKPRKVKVVRARLENRTVLSGKAGDIPLLRILRFSNTTFSEMRRALLSLAKAPAMIIDLRSNPGGDLEAATDCAGLFLPKGRVIAEIKGRGDSKTVRSTTLPLSLPTKIYIWQDQGTASAAEVFTAALVQNKRAVSLGQTSFGKAMRQSIYKLLDGSVIILSDAKILTPDGAYYHGQGLKPTHGLKGSPPDQEAYLAKTKELAATPAASGAEQEVRVRVSTSQAAPPAPVDLVFVACFQSKFQDQRAAEVFSAEVRNSVDNGGHYLIRLKDGRYRVCLGPYPDRNAAQAKQQEIESSLPDQKLFVLGVPRQALQVKTAVAATTTGKPAKASGATTTRATTAAKPPTKTTKSAAAGKWAIGAGYFEADSARDSALETLQKLKKLGMKCWVEIKGYKSQAQADKAIAYFKRKGFTAKWLAPCAQGPAPCLVRYWVYAGPYPAKDEALLQRLIKQNKLPSGAYWVESR